MVSGIFVLHVFVFAFFMKKGFLLLREIGSWWVLWGYAESFSFSLSFLPKIVCWNHGREFLSNWESQWWICLFYLNWIQNFLHQFRILFAFAKIEPHKFPVYPPRFRQKLFRSFLTDKIVNSVPKIMFWSCNRQFPAQSSFDFDRLFAQSFSVFFNKLGVDEFEEIFVSCEVVLL